MISIPLLITETQPCPYLDEKDSQSIFVHPSFSLNTTLYSQLITQGFRRSGNEVYAPHCPSCKQCVASRIDVAKFITSKSQKRCLKKNFNTTAIIKPARFEQAHYDMYVRYQEQKHQGGSMANSTAAEYIDFLGSDWCNTLFIEFSIANKLAAVAVVDLLDGALSAVYTFFEPDLSQYSLGTYAVLWQIIYAKALNLDHVYLGFWIKDCGKMSYKTQYRPLEGLIENQWINLN